MIAAGGAGARVRPRLPRRAVPCLLALLGSCMPPGEYPLETDPVPVEALAPAPELRIGLLVDAARVRLGGPTLRITDPDEGDLADLAPDPLLEAVAEAGVVTLRGGETTLRRRVLLLRPVDSLATVQIDGRAYRGAIELRAGPRGLLVVNRLDLESYLGGVVGAEMGRRTPEEIEALKAQAVASRTYALRNMGRWRDQGFDLVADVNAQAYVGIAQESPQALEAVRATRGEILVYDGAPIDAFYSSTCSGRSEDARDVFPSGRPYLRALPDLDPSGTAWCAASPRFRWTEQWTAAELAATLRRTLPVNGMGAARAGDLTEMRVLDRSTGGRINRLELAGRNGRTVLTGQVIRRVLSPTGGGLLRSTDFTVRIARRGGRLERLEIDGRGNGHAVGMCQWGAVGRARAGQDYRTILTGYFPGTEFRRDY